ncbi:thioredoxin-like protein [Truncatella angustata]|uniref:Thioredoxin-like protein n=1 Tax=Truncatella angustata TaxID=152316 RepID=A0A9P8UDL0_9PEZI|nr:thioredoxin-like protein [Truncatella angustata]KAH6647962.1 thioredoxin-like protein [Truncatella angustata]KAH8203654.1 hypothetical protein TruAng_002184 [Truncatella angustata]
MASINELLSPVAEPSSSPEQSPQAFVGQKPESLHFTIEFVLDTACPHCYIGLKNLNAAIDAYKLQHPNATFEVTCSPVILSPSAGRSVDTKEVYYQTIRGFAPSTIQDWTRQGQESGINFSWQEGRTGNSRDSHKLLRLALEATPSTYRSSSFTRAFGHNRLSTTSSSLVTDVTPVGARGPQTQMQLADTIYREYFENNRDLSDRSFLLNTGTSLTNIPAEEIQACLESDEWDYAIDRLSDRNKMEFNAVPVFIIQGRFVAGGWQTPQKLLDIFEHVRAEGPNAPGRILSVPGGGWWMPGGVFRGANQDAAETGRRSAFGSS